MITVINLNYTHFFNLKSDLGLLKFLIFNLKTNSLLKWEFKANFVRFPDISYPDENLPDLVHFGATSSFTRNTGKKSRVEFDELSAV